jgi:large repetitive protein
MAVSVDVAAQCTANAGAPLSGCAGATVTLGGTPAATGAGPFTYSWSPATGLSSATVANPTLTIPSSTTTYTLTVTGDNCTNSSQVTVTVLATPAITLTSPDGNPDLYVAPGGSSFALCGTGLNNYGFQITDNSVAQPGAVFSVDWGYPPNAFTPTNTGWAETHTYPVGLHSITYTITNPNGCSTTAIVDVFLGSNPSVGTSNPGNTVVCSGSELVFPINSTTNNSPGTQYVVTYGDGNTTTFAHPPPSSVAYSYPSTNCPGAPYTFRIDAITPCPIVSFATAGPIYITDTPQASFTVSPNDTACVNSTVTFTNTSLGFNGTNCNAPQRVWSITPATGYALPAGMGNANGSTQPSQWTSGSNTINVQFTQAGTYCIQLLVGNNLCGTDVVEQCICIEAPPVPQFTLAPSVGCAPLSSTIDNLSASPNACLTRYLWNATGSGSACGTGADWDLIGGTSATSFEPQFRFNQPGNYTVQLQAINSCGTFQVVQPVTVNAPPQLTLAPLSGICATQCVNPSASVQACGAPIDTYAWTFPGGTPGTANTASPGSVCFANAGDPTVSLTVTNACGSATANANLAVGTLPPLPVVSSNSPVCQGQTLSLSAVLIPGVTYSWTGPNGFTSNQPSITINGVSAVNAGTYTVVAVSSGCSGPPATVEVVVVAAPPVSIAPSSAAVCVGQSTTLTASGAGNYQWYIGATLVGTGPSLTTSPAITTTYTVTGSTGGCPGNATVTVTVYPLPNVNAGVAQTLCDQAIPVTLTGSPAPGTWSGPIVTPGGVFTPIPDSIGVFTLTYSHTNSNGCTNTATVNITVQELTLIANAGPDTSFCLGTVPVSLPHSPPGGTWVGAGAGGQFTPSTVGSFAVIYNYGTGTCATSDQVQVQVLPAPVLTVPPSFTLCADASTVALTATPPGGVWTGPGINGVPAEFDPGAVPAGQHVLTYTYSDGSGCVATAQTTATVNALPIVNAGVDVVLCDQPVPFFFSATPTGGTWTSTWMNVTPDGEFTPNGLGTDQLTYTVVNASGCTASDSIQVDVVLVDEPAIAGPDTAVCINSGALQLNGLPNGGTWSGPQVSASGLVQTTTAGVFTLTYSVGSATCLTIDQVTVTVNALPAVDAGGDISVCLDGGIQILVADPPGGTWSGVGVDPVTGAFDPALALPGGNPVTYSFTDPNTGCTYSDDATVTVNPLPVAGFSHAPVACAGVGFTFTNTSTGASNAQWDFGDTGTSIAISPTHVYTSTGTFTVTLVVGTGAGCSDSFSSTVEVWDVPQTALTLSVDSGCGPLEVAFTNGSTGEGLEYLWDFGGLASSTDQDPPSFSFPPDPQDAITYTVSLTVSNTCGSSSVSEPITVIPVPTAVFGPNVNNHCAFTDVPFGNASFGQPDSFEWDFGDGTSSTLPGPIVTHAFAGGPDAIVYTITLVATNACGSDTAQQNITVVPNEVTSFFNTDPIQGCVPLTVSLTQFSTGDTAWVWDFGDGNTSLVYEPTHTFTQPGTYTIELYSYGCGFDSYSTDVTVYPGPDVAFTVAPNAVCVGEAFTFTDLTPGLGGSAWDFGDGNSSPLSVVEHAYDASGTYDVTLTVTSALNGCTASLTQQVTVQTTPVASFTPQPASGCIDLTVVFQNTTQNGSFYTWDFGNGNTSATASPTHTYGVAGTYMVTLIAESVNGCSDTASVPVVAHPLPTSSFVLGSQQSCTSPVTVQTTNTSMGAVGYAWDFGNGTTSELNQPSIEYSGPGTYTVRLTATNQFGCSDEWTEIFIVHPTPEAAFIAAPQPACAGSPVFFTNNSVNATTYQWSFGDGTTSTGDAPLHIYEEPGDYTVVLIATGSGGCTDTLVLTNGIVVNPSPIAAFSVDTLTSLLNALQFNNQSEGATEFFWDFGDGETSEEVHPTHLFPGDGGSFVVCLAVVNTLGCPDTVCAFIGVRGDPGIYVPNTFTPNDDGLNDVFLPVLNSFIGWNYRLLIFDRWGEVIHESRDRNAGWDGRARGQDSQVDVYLWKVIVERDGDARDFVGHVSLVR